MYLDHFGLQQLPFATTPDTHFVYQHGGYQAALNVLLLALRSGEGFIKIVGEVGTGKTLLCRLLLDRLSTEMTTAYIPNPHLNPNGLRAALADELGLDAPRNLGQHRLLQRLSQRLMDLAGEGRQVVVVVDEAQAMPIETLEALRLLSNLETERHKLIQLVLFGQPELDRRLDRVRQLKQRIGFSYRLEPLPRRETARYLDCRVAAAGHAGPSLFTPRAARALHRASDGLPRLINILAHKALMAAYGRGHRRVQARHVRRAAADTESARQPPRWAMATLLTGLAAVAATGVAAGSYVMGLLP